MNSCDLMWLSDYPLTIRSVCLLPTISVIRRGSDCQGQRLLQGNNLTVFRQRWQHVSSNKWPHNMMERGRKWCKSAEMRPARTRVSTQTHTASDFSIHPKWEWYWNTDKCSCRWSLKLPFPSCCWLCFTLSETRARTPTQLQCQCVSVSSLTH